MYKRMIPYEKIDYEMRQLIYIFNKLSYIQTIGCCIGHHENPIAEVIFKVHDNAKWHTFIIKLLQLNNRMIDANINFYEWHRLDLEKQYLIDWKMTIEVHPRNREDLDDEHKRLLGIKNQVLKCIAKEIEKEVEIAALPL